MVKPIGHLVVLFGILKFDCFSRRLWNWAIGVLIFRGLKILFLIIAADDRVTVQVPGGDVHGHHQGQVRARDAQDPARQGRRAARGQARRLHPARTVDLLRRLCHRGAREGPG